MPVKTVLDWLRGAPRPQALYDAAPVSTLLALEPRLMFDGAAAVTADAAPAAERTVSAAERSSAPAARTVAAEKTLAPAPVPTTSDKPGAVDCIDGAKSAQPGTVTLTMVARNGGSFDPAIDGATRVTAGDTVTFTLDYLAPQGDFHGLQLSARLPGVAFDAADPRGDGSGRSFSATDAAGGLPPVGTYSVRLIGGDGSALPPPTVQVDRATNTLNFVFGDRYDCGVADARIQISFTVSALPTPVVDGTVVSAVGEARTLDANGTTVASQELEALRIKAPNLDIVKGVVQDDVVRPSSVSDPSYSPSDPRSLMLPAGNTGAQPLRGLLDASGVRALDTDIAGVDAGDTLRFAIVVTNTGGTARGAFDVTLDDNLPWGMDRASVANLRITTGDGRVIYDGTAATLSRITDGDGNVLRTTADAIAALLDGCGLRLVDDAGADGIAGTTDDRGALAGIYTDGNGTRSAPGANVLVVSYDARVAPWIEPGKTLWSAATLTSYASNEGGPDFTGACDPFDAATVQTTLLSMQHRLIATSEPDRTSAGADAVVGERLTYEITIAVPEGMTLDAILSDRLAPGLSLVSVDSITASPGVVFTGGTPSTGSVRVWSDGGDANRFELDLGDIVNGDTDNARRETITIRYTAVADNVAQNRQGATLGNQATLDAYCISVSADAPDVRVVEPSLSVTIDGGMPRPAAGDTVVFTVTVTAASGRPPAQDVSLEIANLVPSGLSYVPGSLEQVSGPRAGSLSFGGSGITGDWSSLGPGEQVVLRFDARIVDGTPTQPLEQTATVRWSSLPGTTNTDLSPVASVGDFERTGRPSDPGGTLNTYVASSSAPVSTLAGLAPRLDLIASSEAGSSGTTVVPGEVLRYRMVVLLPEGALTDVEIRPVLPAGLRFVADGTTTLGFVADGAGFTSSTLTGSSWLLPGGGADFASIAGLQPLQPLPAASIRDASGATVLPGTVLPAGQVPRIALGDLTIADRDANREFVVIEFDAIVDNAAGNVAGTANPVVFDVTSAGTAIARSNMVVVEVAEPRIVDLDKSVIAVSGNQVVFEATFSNTGTQTAYDVRLVDVFAGVPGVTFAGAVARPAGSTDASTADTLDLRLPQLAPGETATVRYVVTLSDPSVAVAPRDAVVTYTSLSSSGTTLPVQTVGGTRLTPTTGERTGDTADYGAGANSYRDADPAGLAAVTGTLWDDTNTPDGAIGVGESRLAGVTVVLTSGGRDGRLGTADDLVLSTVTDSQGRYAFGGLPEGELRIVAPTTIGNANGSLGEVRARFDGQGSPSDATMVLRVDEGTTATDLDVGYVQRNDAPTVVAPARVGLPTDGAGPIPGLSIGDVDAGPTGVLDVTLTVGEGTLQVVPGAPGTTVVGNGTGALSLTGSVDALNALLATLTYQANAGFDGTDRLTVTVNDRGNIGDADGDGIPNEPVDDALTVTSGTEIRIGPSKFPPVALPDANRIGAADTQPARGNVLGGGSAGDRADSDPDGDPLEVQGVRAGTDTSSVAQGSTDVPVAGRYGSIVVGPDGRYAYQVDTTNADVQRLKPGQSLTDSFVYTVRDPSGLTSTTTITITIDGVNDAPNASSVSQTIDAPQPGTPAPRVPVAPPTVIDRDDAGTDLVVRVDEIERPQGGSFLRPDGTPVLPGQTLTVDQLQRLTFVPSTDFTGVPRPDGTTATSSLVFTVSDPSGATSSGRIDLSLRPSSPTPGLPGVPPAPSPPSDPNASSSITIVAPGGPTAIAGVREDAPGYLAPRPAEFPPISNGPGVQFSVPFGGSGPGSPAIATTVADLRDDTIDGREALDTASRTIDLDADGLLPSNRVAGFFGEEAIGPLRDTKSNDGSRPLATTSTLAIGPGLLDPASGTALAAAPAPIDGAAAGRVPTEVAGKSAQGAAPARPPVAADDDCKPVVVAKPRPKPVKRILSDQVVPKSSTSFSEQIDVQKKKFKLPPKVAPKPPLERQC